MIDNIWIVTRSGLCIFSRNYNPLVKNNMDDMVFGGFISAFFSFSEEIEKGKVQIEEIKFKKQSLLYNADKEIIIVVSTNKKNPSSLKDTLKNIKDVFHTIFPQKNDNIINTDTTEYNQLKTKIDSIVQRKAEITDGKRIENITMILGKVFENKIEVKEAANRIKEYYGNDINIKTRKDFNRISSLIEEMEAVEINPEQQKNISLFKAVTDELFDWKKLSKEFISRGW